MKNNLNIFKQNPEMRHPNYITSVKVPYSNLQETKNIICSMVIKKDLVVHIHKRM